MNSCNMPHFKSKKLRDCVIIQFPFLQKMLLITCVICKQVVNIGQEEVCSTSRCGHVGHTSCFNKWINLYGSPKLSIDSDFKLIDFNFRSACCPQCRTETTNLVKLHFETTEMESEIDNLKQEIISQKNKRQKLIVLMNRTNENKTLLNERITMNPADFPNRLSIMLDRNLENRRIQRHIVNINPSHFDERQLMIELNREEENLRIREHLSDISDFQ